MNNNVPTVIVVLGATGDLVKKKIAPALLHLFEKGMLPQLFRLVAFSRRAMTDESYRSWLVDHLSQHDRQEVIPSAFLERISYLQGDLAQRDDYRRLGGLLGITDEGWNACSNKLFYVAVPPGQYETVIRHLAESGLTKPCSDKTGWTRILIEKPFGSDLASAKALDTLLGTLFREEQIYRIDHYLAKEMVQNILAFRFANNLLEDIWGNHAIEKITVRLWETIGVEERGAFYDGVGALRDVGQNHLLQILALLTMAQPAALCAKEVRENRTDILERVKPPDSEHIETASYRAQYDGYRRIAGVSSGTTTETFFTIRLSLDTPAWEGVPIVLESGKRLAEVKKEAVLTLKHPTPCLCPGGEHLKNRIVISLAPKEGITMEFWAKKPGLSFELEKQTMSWTLRESKEKIQYVEEYEKLLVDAIAGDQMLFASSREIAAMWAVIDPIVSAWKKSKPPLGRYAAGTLPTVPTPSPAKKELVIVGLGKMGGNLARRAMEKGWRVVGHNRTTAVAEAMMGEGLVVAKTPADIARLTHAPRIVWLMLPAGPAVDEMLTILYAFLKKGDIIIDGGNSFYQDAARRSKEAQRHGVTFIDVGVSGGPLGARQGPCLMVGGNEQTFGILEPLLADMSENGSYRFFPGAGAGHFAKMVHNAIEYGMMESIAEGMELLKKSPLPIDLPAAVAIYQRRSVIESRLVGWLESAFAAHGKELADVTSTVGHTGEAAWAIDVAKALGISLPAIEASLAFRLASRDTPTFRGKVLSALREQFGQHSAKQTP